MFCVEAGLGPAWTGQSPVPTLYRVRHRAILQPIMETLFYFRASSPAGPLFLAASTKGFGRLELDDYFAGQRRAFSFPLDLRGTEFQLACWHALLEIPYGETRSYRDIAEAIGHPQACRAVGMANNRNPVAIVVPCHRVIASSGSLCGYGGGLDL